MNTRDEALKAALEQINKSHGEGSVVRMGDGWKLDVQVIPTGALTLDLALGVRGLPRGRIVEIYGPESSGKTTVCLHVIAEAQSRGGTAAFIDAEHALDPIYASNLGVDVPNLYLSQPDTGEQALEIVDTLVRSGAFDVIVVDSVAALVPRAELEGEMTDQHVGLQARMMSKAMRKLAGNVNKSKTLLVFTNQLREKIGVMFGSPETTPGGRALKFAASVRLDVRRVGQLKDKEEEIGNQIKVKVVKNKVGAPHSLAFFDIEWGKGISKEGAILDVGVEEKVLKKSGAWFNYGETRLGQGRENAKDFLAANPDVRDQIEDEIYKAIEERENADA